MSWPKSYEEFYSAVGLAIFQWSRVESAFRDVFIRLILCGLTGKGMGNFQGEGVFLLGTVFDSTGNLPGRLSLINHMVMRLVTDDQLKAEWKFIKKRSLKLLTDRNVLVHGEAWNRENSEIPQFVRYSVFSKDDKEMNFDGIVQATPEFFDYAERVTKFAINVNAHLAKRNVREIPSSEP